VLLGGPRDFISAPGVGDSAIATDVLDSDNEFGDYGRRRVGREPELVEPLFADARLGGMRREDHAVFGEQRANAVGIAFEPSILILFVDTPDFANVVGG